MFNAEKILGGLLQGGMGKSAGFGLKGGAAMGALGIAMEAASHYLERSRPGPSSGSSSGSQPSVPPPPPGTAPSSPQAPPPPPPGKTARPVPAAAGPPPVPASTEQSVPADDRQIDAVVLIRAMIAAANADGAIDADERQRIMGQLQRLDLSGEEQSFILNELLNPGSLEQVVAQVTSPPIARQVYTASLLTITIDTEAERVYMDALARQMGLSREEVESIHDEVGR